MRCAVDVRLHRAEVEEVPRHIEHHAAVGEARGIGDLDLRDRPGIRRIDPQLVDRLRGVEQPGLVGRGYGDAGGPVRGAAVASTLISAGAGTTATMLSVGM